jgi:uncharacterized protein YndB with AHSA1/START domain
MPFDGITIRRTLKAPRARVFAAWTQPELMARWYFPGQGWVVNVACDLKVGGRYQLSMRDLEGGAHLQFGIYREIVPVSRLVFTWTCPDLGVTDSVVTVELAEKGGGTELSLSHLLPPDPKIRAGHEEGWQGCLGNLEALLNHPMPKENTMDAIRDEVRIQTGAAKVYEALTRQAGYRGWWNAVGEVAEREGGEAVLRFVKDGQPVNMRFRIDETRPNQLVRWTCVAHDMNSWVGTTLTWPIQEAGGAVLLAFEHGGWKDAAPGPVKDGWKHFLGSLKAYLETGTGQPW